MSLNSRTRALALKIGCAALMLAFAGFARAVPVEVNGAEPEATRFSVTYTVHQQLPSVDVVMNVGNPPPVASVLRGPVVEPGTLALLGLGLVIIGLTISVQPRRRRDRTRDSRESP